MRTDMTWAKAGLVFINPREFDIVELANLVVTNCEALGHRTGAVHILSDTSAYICLDAQELSLSLQDEMAFSALPKPAGTYVGIAAANVASSDSSRFARDSLLARSLQAIHAETRPDYVRWIDTDVLLTSKAFASAIGSAAEHTRRKVIAGSRTRNSRAALLPDIEDTNAMLQQRLADQDPAIFNTHSAPDRLREAFTAMPSPAYEFDPTVVATTPNRLAETHPLRIASAWFLSVFVLILALPIGIALLMLNLMRGRNLRLASQTAALTVVFVALQSSLVSAEALQALVNLLR